MNLNNVRNEIIKELGINHHFVFKGIRNQVLEFDGVIVKCFPSIFLIKSSDNTYKSFSYSDYIINNIKIIS